MPLFHGPLRWNANDGMPRWVMPPAATGMIDLTAPGQTAPGNEHGDFGGEALLLAPTLGPQYTHLGSELNDTLSASAKSAMGVTSSRLRFALLERMLEGADATGAARNRPFLPSRKRKAVRFVIGSIDLSVPVSLDMPGFATIRAAMKADVLAAPQAFRRKMAWKYLTERFGVTPTREHCAAWLDIDDTPETPQTTLGPDPFTVGANTALASYSGAGITWANVNSITMTVSGANDRVEIGAAAGDGTARAEHDLSSDDHYAQLDIGAAAASNTMDGGCICRVATGSTPNLYLGQKILDSSGPIRFYKRVSGTFTQLAGDVASSYSATTIVTIKLEVDASDLEFFQGGVSQATRTDSAITGNLRSGFRIVSGSSTVVADNWEASDLAAPAGHCHRKVNGTRLFSKVGGGLVG